MPALQLEGGLERVVDGAQIAARFVDHAKLGELGCVRPGAVDGAIGGVWGRRVDIEQAEQMRSLRPYIADLGDDGRGDAVLDVQIEGLRI
jgi:hypothetical protein